MTYTETKIVGKAFCESLREHAMKIISIEKRKMKILINKQQESNENAKIYFICKENFENKYLKDGKYGKRWKLEIFVITQESIEVLLIAYAT